MTTRKLGRSKPQASDSILSQKLSARLGTLGKWFLLVAPMAAATGCGTLNQSQLALPSSQALLNSPRPAVHSEPAVMGTTQQASSPVVPVSYNTPGFNPPAGAPATQCYDGQCGCPQPTNCQGACGVCAPGTPTAPRRNAQEYIFDGGDQEPTTVVRKDWSAAGVDPTDTVIYYETLGGQVCVKESNRVPIYAPRFGAVRQVTGAILASRAVGTKRILAPVKPGRFDDLDLAGSVMQPVAPLGEEQIGLIDAFQESRLGVPIAQIVPPSRMSEARVPFEGVDVIGTGRITDEEIAVMGEILENARTWFTPESIDVMVDGQAALQLKDTIRAQDVFVYEMPDKCAMRICKAASHSIADSGDVVSFTIRFDNSGVKPLGNAVIMDSLSPRLEYIEGSQQCSVEARFSTEPNEVGSAVLRWEVVSPIEPSDGGVISFDCRVR